VLGPVATASRPSYQKVVFKPATVLPAVAKATAMKPVETPGERAAEAEAEEEQIAEVEPGEVEDQHEVEVDENAESASVVYLPNYVSGPPYARKAKNFDWFLFAELRFGTAELRFGAAELRFGAAELRFGAAVRAKSEKFRLISYVFFFSTEYFFVFFVLKFFALIFYGV